jgi:hypothetical protein
MRSLVLGIQALTYLALGGLMASEGLWKLAAAQWLLAVVQVLIFS